MFNHGKPGRMSGMSWSPEMMKMKIASLWPLADASTGQIKLAGLNHG
jgi:hypothetical protein